MRATRQSIGYDLHTPTVWTAGKGLDKWHAVTVQFQGVPESVVYMQRVATPHGAILGPSTIVSGPHVDRAEDQHIVSVVMHPGARVGVDHGVHLQVTGCYGTIRGRSGMRSRGISILGDGTIDPDYPGKLISWLWNVGHEDVEIKAGQAVTQLVMSALPPAHNLALWTKDTERTGGFGSTDVQHRSIGTPDCGYCGLLTCDLCNMEPSK